MLEEKLHRCQFIDFHSQNLDVFYTHIKHFNYVFCSEIKHFNDVFCTDIKHFNYFLSVYVVILNVLILCYYIC